MRTPHSLRFRRWPLRAALAAALAAATPAFAATFGGSNTGAIPDNDPAGRDIGFTVDGLQQGVRRVSLSVTMTHTWAADLTLTLISPTGARGWCCSAARV